jgi:hypothetical protein
MTPVPMNAIERDADMMRGVGGKTARCKLADRHRAMKNSRDLRALAAVEGAAPIETPLKLWRQDDRAQARAALSATTLGRR